MGNESNEGSVPGHCPNEAGDIEQPSHGEATAAEEIDTEASTDTTEKIAKGLSGAVGVTAGSATAVACASAGAFKVAALPMGVAVGGAGMGAAALAPAVIVGAGIGSITYLGIKHGPKTAKAVGRAGRTLGSQFAAGYRGSRARHNLGGTESEAEGASG